MNRITSPLRKWERGQLVRPLRSGRPRGTTIHDSAPLLWGFFLLFSLFVLFAATACRPTPPPEPTPEEIVQNAAARMSKMTGFHFAIAHSGPPAYLEPTETVSLIRADGDYAAPDRAQAAVLVKLTGFVTKIDVISVADIQWQTNPLTGKWEELPPNWGFNPAVLFDAEIGLQAILAADVSELTLTGREKLEDGPDAELYALIGVVAGERLYQMSGGLISPEATAVQLWIMPETFELARVILTETGADQENPSVWQVDLFNYDQVVEIEPPQ
ncbi:MAG: LppX_LprAFG lipoprotein [Chloroflexi bacterium]|nr:LppX_LprAFG lipoprotein [Chloroflexota bacterium]